MRYTIRYHDERQVISIEPTSPEVEAALVLRSIAVTDDPDHGYRLERRGESLLRPERVTANAGLASMAAYQLLQLGHEIEIVGPLARPLAPPLPCQNPHVADLVHTRSHGLVRHSLGAHELRALCVDLSHALEGARIAFVASRKHDARHLHATLARYFSSVALTFPEMCSQVEPRLIVATPYGLAYPDIICDPIDVVIWLDAAASVGETGAMAMAASGFARSRFFGCVREHIPLPPRVRDLMMAAYGPAEVSVPRPGYQRCPIDVVWTTITGGRHCHSASPAELHRRGIVHHPLRNRRIAALGRAIVTGDTAKAHQICSEIRDTACLVPCSTMIVVSGVEHAVELARRLPDWGVVLSDDANLDGLSGAQRSMAARCRQLGPGWIVTVAALPSVWLWGSGAVIWAAGGVGLPSVPPSQLMYPAEHVRELLWIDIDDAHHRDLWRASRSRRAAYAAAGWYPAGTRGTLARIRQYLAERSGDHG